MTGLILRSDWSEMLHLSDRIAQVPKELRAGLRPAMREVGQKVLADARKNAAWSTRIPGALELRISTEGKNAGVVVQARKQDAPHARPFEGITQGSTFRHPVFGNTDVWVSQAARPFLLPAARAHKDEAVRVVLAAIDDALARAGVTS